MLWFFSKNILPSLTTSDGWLYTQNISVFEIIFRRPGTAVWLEVFQSHRPRNSLDGVLLRRGDKARKSYVCVVRFTWYFDYD